jgi:hypothetical protein
MTIQYGSSSVIKELLLDTLELGDFAVWAITKMMENEQGVSEKVYVDYDFVLTTDDGSDDELELDEGEAKEKMMAMALLPLLEVQNGGLTYEPDEPAKS